MSKILIASIGEGSFNKESNEKTYREAEYYIEPNRGETLKTAYIYEALLKFYSIDKIIFVGTCGSNWFMFYEHLCDPKCYDEDYALELLTLYEAQARYMKDPAEIQALLKKKIPDVLGPICADIVVLKYGLNSEEILENFSLLAAISEHVQDGDSIYFDITHSFRSLAIYELLAVSYFKDVLKKDVKLEFVSYGMFEFSRENNNLTPIVDLSQLVNLLDWIKAAEEYKRFGTTYKLAELLELPGNNFLQKEKEVFAALGDIITTNQWDSFKSVVDKCIAIRDKQEKIGIKNYIFNDIADNFAEARNDEMLLRLTLAKWYAAKTRYIAAAVTAVEAMITYGVNLVGLKMTDANRDTIRRRLNNSSIDDPIVKNFLSLYNHIRFKIRNPLSHAGSQKTDIKKFQRYLESLCGIYKGQFKANTGKANILGRVLGKH